MTKLKCLLSFITGVAFGALVTIAKLYHDILSKPTEPVLDLDGDWIIPDVYTYTQPEDWRQAYTTFELLEMADEVEDARPVQVDSTYDMTPAEVADFLDGMEVGAHDLAQWAEESD